MGLEVGREAGSHPTHQILKPKTKQTKESNTKSKFIVSCRIKALLFGFPRKQDKLKKQTI